VRKAVSLVSYFLLMCFFLSGCTRPVSSVDAFFYALQKGDIEKAAQYLKPNDNGDNVPNFDLTDSDPDQINMFKEMFSKLQYETLSSEVEGNTAQVDARVTAVDLARVTTQVMSELIPLAFASAFSEDQDDSQMEKLAEQYMMNAISDPNSPMVTNRVTLTLEKVDGKWLIVTDDQLEKALVGNLEVLSAFGGSDD